MENSDFLLPKNDQFRLELTLFGFLGWEILMTHETGDLFGGIYLKHTDRVTNMQLANTVLMSSSALSYLGQVDAP